MDLEEMSSFFNKRVNEYEEHMMNNVGGANQYYIETAKLIPRGKEINILDLGCGTGLELDEIFKINNTVRVTGIDLAENMLRKIKEKHKDKLDRLTLIVGDYFSCDIGEKVFDAALSVETLHHFNHEQKIKLYKKIVRSLKDNGVYIEADYMAPNQDYEDHCFNENKRIRLELGIKDGFYHYDTPCTVENQIKMLYKSGFKSVEKVFKAENTVILLAKK
ncbi:tRNA (cmo5U34)-methyltransferase [Clostridium acetobutylicum]|nr:MULTISPECIES: class I SAM-dependent methyltransferase [Clostridium]ADZ19593.1 SAM-dependent methyltransferase [Clostridium acetobutylicum EA 2018]MBC2392427.1 class I SAM-dependent methyltransferase [Clostridium acetobutylicum]MBC2583721.1 class I SAM-dependent methyltransferase [Clostridium acetobutylicum]NOV89344.1 tRNA (cmo5U34)-methyltransferase [Clostridium acetobutylicum]NOW16125.1 tRNA (cmo5U34)-methyltransferase [Clostridium acetobutylicum]